MARRPPKYERSKNRMSTATKTRPTKSDVVEFTCTPGRIHLGAQIELTAVLQSRADRAQAMIVDFVVHHVMSDGSTSPKVFKWATPDVAPGDTAVLRKRRTVKTASTRRYHAGTHRVDLQVAGQVVASTAFDLEDSSPRR